MDLSWKRPLDAFLILLALPFLIPLALLVTLPIAAVPVGRFCSGRSALAIRLGTSRVSAPMFVDADTTTHQEHLHRDEFEYAHDENGIYEGSRDFWLGPACRAWTNLRAAG